MKNAVISLNAFQLMQDVVMGYGILKNLYNLIVGRGGAVGGVLRVYLLLLNGLCFHLSVTKISILLRSFGL